MYERLFCILFHAVTNSRERIWPSNFKSQLFVYMNCELHCIYNVK